MTGHRRQYKYFLKTGKKYCSSFIILEQGAIHYELIEKYPCESKQQLCRREGHWQKKMKCINKDIAGRTKKEYYQENKEQLLKHKKEYYQKNKEEILKYYKKNKIKINEKHVCICCDGRYTTGNWSRHQKTKKHVKAQKLQEQLQDLIPLYHQ